PRWQVSLRTRKARPTAGLLLPVATLSAPLSRSHWKSGCRMKAERNINKAEGRGENRPQHESRVALVTGAGSGIGRCIAGQLAVVDGAMVAVLDRDETAARGAVAEIREAGGRAEAFIADLADTESLQAALHDIDTRLGQPDIVVNNAGVAATMPATEYALS